MKVGAIYGSMVASGSMGTSVASHNSGGLYLRSRAIPTQPGSSQQSAVRGRMVQLSAAWNLLSSDNQQQWSNYAAAVTVVNSVGASIHLSGRNWFIAANSERLAGGLAVVSAGPSELSRAGLTPISMACTSSSVVQVSFSNTDKWATATGGALLIFTSRPQSPRRNFFKGPYRYAGHVLGAASAPTSPATISSPFAIANGQRVFFRAVAVEPDGRTSADATGFCSASIS